VFLLCREHDPCSLYLGAMITGMDIFTGCGYGSHTRIATSTLQVLFVDKMTYFVKIMGGLRNSQTYFSSSYFRNLECHSLISKGCKWPCQKVKIKNLNERQLCMYKLLLHEHWWSSSIQGVTYDPYDLYGLMCRTHKFLV
jgi:hypothetical protein